MNLYPSVENLRSAPAPHPLNCGDLLLLFNTVAPEIRRTPNGAWQCFAQDTHWNLQAQPVDDDWVGNPLVVAKEGAWHLWLLGELYGLPDRTHAAEEYICALATGRIPATSFNGHATLLAWNNESRTWHVWTDRFGTLHLYYASSGTRAALGSFSPAVARAASTRQLDWHGLTGFFAWGFFPQDRTQYTDMHILRPASHYVFDEQGKLLRQERYWQWRHTSDEGRSYSNTLADLDSVLRTVLSEQLAGGRIALPISGGLDSRTTVALVQQQAKDNLWSYSYGYGKASVETRIAHQVAKARNLPFQEFSIGSYLFDDLPKVLACLEGFQDIILPRQASVTAELARHADYVIAAHLGDLWFNTMGLADIETTGHVNIVDYARHKFEKRGRHWLLENMCAGKIAEQSIDELLYDMLQTELDALSQIEDLDFRIKALKTDQWSFRWTTTSFRMYQAGALPRLPFYDTRIADFFCTVPSKMLKGRRLQIDYLKRFAPDLARITWQVYDANLYNYQHFNTWQLPQRAVKKTWRLLTRKKPVERNWEIQLLSAEGRRGLDYWLRRPGLRLHDLISLRELNALLEAFYADPLSEGRGYTVSMLLTFSAWLEVYGP